ncbi:MULTISPECIES: hypothetical protein [Moorena]|nr:MULTISPECIES: hypothetical protein [Moorena]NEQ07398.1 hypothetical protein [Moorena sp. SIO4E2]NER87816.1 hypothetical protein [Moorena sp. SIO3A2]NES43694.1 hypothetical protein [Moorena sp. SIO2C4]NET67872.1 hypothetical protein [Moorena sp. SIO1G6]
MVIVITPELLPIIQLQFPSRYTRSRSVGLCPKGLAGDGANSYGLT